MRVYVNGKAVNLALGMSVKHALIALDLLKEIQKGRKAYDAQGNELGLDGALAPEQKIFVR